MDEKSINKIISDLRYEINMYEYIKQELTEKYYLKFDWRNDSEVDMLEALTNDLDYQTYAIREKINYYVSQLLDNSYTQETIVEEIPEILSLDFPVFLKSKRK